MRKITILTLMAVAIVGSIVLTAGIANAAKPVDPPAEPKYKICHRSNSVSNPYQENEVARSSVDGIGGQGDHYLEDQGPLAVSEEVAQALKDAKEDWGDIIPPVYDDNNVLIHAGLNWTTEGQLMWENGCNYVTGQGGNGGTDPETPVAPETPVVTPAASTISTLPYTGNGLLEVLSALGLSAAALGATYFASVKSFKFLNK